MLRGVGCRASVGRLKTVQVLKVCSARTTVFIVFGVCHTSVDIGASANVELVDKFCYLGDMLSVDGDADAAVEARI